MRYRDVSADPNSASVACPKQVAALVGCGFRSIGKAVVELDQAPEVFAAHYEEPDRQWFLDHWDVPTAVLLSPDAKAIADVSEFYGAPAIRLRSLLEDGSLLETVRVWDRLPVLNKKSFPWGHQEDATAQVCVGHAPQQGRSILALEVAEDAAPLLWEQHQTHLETAQARRQQAALSLESFDDYVALNEAALAHEQQLRARRGYIAIGVMLAYLPLLVSVVFEVADRVGPRPAAALAVVAAVFAATRLPRLAHLLGIKLGRFVVPQFRLDPTSLTRGEAGGAARRSSSEL